MFELETFYSDNKQVFEYALYLIRNKKYKKITISKKNGSLRELSIPHPAIKVLQKKLNTILQSEYLAPDCVHGFCSSQYGKNKTILTNAKLHIKKNFVLNIDIKDFFPTINFGRVRGMFLSKPFHLDKKNATKLAQLVTYQNELPQGAPTSPILSNLICRKLDHELMTLAKQNSFTYSRYADDITFSTNRKKHNVNRVKKEIIRIIKKNGFKINPEKTRLQHFKQRQIVTGLIVNEKVNLNKKYRRRVRSMLYSWYSDGLVKATEKHFDKKIKDLITQSNLKKLFYKIISLFFKKFKYEKILREKKKNRQIEKYELQLTNSFQNILLGHIDFVGQVKGKNSYIYKDEIHKYYLLKSDFYLYHKNDYYEHLDIHQADNLKKKLLLKKIYNTHLVFTEGVTDIIYLKSALKFFQKKNKYENIKLRFCHLSGWTNLKNFHIALHSSSKTKDATIENIKTLFCKDIPKSLSYSFVLDSDDNGILEYYKSINKDDFFPLSTKDKIYIEELIPQEEIIDIIEVLGYEINPEHPTLRDSKTKNLLRNHLSINADKEKVFSISNFIVYKKRLIKKLDLANALAKNEKVDYSKFENVFQYLEKFF